MINPFLLNYFKETLERLLSTTINAINYKIDQKYYYDNNTSGNQY